MRQARSPASSWTRGGRGGGWRTTSWCSSWGRATTWSMTRRSARLSGGGGQLLWLWPKRLSNAFGGYSEYDSSSDNNYKTAIFIVECILSMQNIVFDTLSAMSVQCNISFFYIFSVCKEMKKWILWIISYRVFAFNISILVGRMIKNIHIRYYVLSINTVYYSFPLHYFRNKKHEETCRGLEQSAPRFVAHLGSVHLAAIEAVVVCGYTSRLVLQKVPSEGS